MVQREQPRRILSLPDRPVKRVSDTLSGVAYFPASTKVQHRQHTTRETHTARWNMTHVTPAQTRRIALEKPYKVTTYADMVKVETLPVENGVIERDSSMRGGGLRGTVSGFSRASRKRMIEFMAKVRNQGTMLFLTLTYDDMAWLVKSDAHHSDLEAFRKRFERAYPTWCALWRVEVKTRKSGLLIGHDVPHFHMLIWTNESTNDPDATAKAFWKWGNIAWHEITGSAAPEHLEYGFHVTALKSRKHAYSYVSKYVAKQDDDDLEIGRRWGRIGNFDTSAGEVFRFNQDEYIEFRRLVKRWLRSKNQRYSRRFARQSSGKGCTIFGLSDTIAGSDRSLLFYASECFISAAKEQARAKLDPNHSPGD